MLSGHSSSSVISYYSTFHAFFVPHAKLSEEFCDGPTHHIASREFELLGAASESPHILKVHCLHEASGWKFAAEVSGSRVGTKENSMCS